MNASFLVSPSLRGWFAASELAPHIETFVERLVRDGYSCRTAANHVHAIAHFARWMSRPRLTVERLDEAAIERFLDRHLPRCDCPPPTHRNRRDLSAGCHLLLRVLRDQGVVPASMPKTDPVKEELCRFDEHMRCARGLCEGTRRVRIGIARRFLQSCFGDQPIVISALQPADVRRFIASPSKRPSVANARARASALRMLQSGIDVENIALWLGHARPTTTHMYVELDLAMKQRTLARLQDPKAKTARYRPPDSLLHFLTTL